jgi:hypothetical protein
LALLHGIDVSVVLGVKVSEAGNAGVVESSAIEPLASYTANTTQG